MQPRNKTTRPDLPIALSLPAFMTPIDTIVYYVADSTDGTGPALWRRIGQRPAEEVIEGVENLQIEFGEDTNDDLMADRYVESPDVADWTNIVAAKIAVLIRTPEETGTETDEQEYDLLGETIDPPDDRRQRIVFTTTANLRNRMN
jgi:type IV pilus assembly protein PilW